MRETQLHTSVPPAPRPRLISLDWLRGLVMVVMVLDHSRRYFGPPTDPTDLLRVR